MSEVFEKCTCATMEVRRRKYANGQIVMGKQCLTCGSWVSVKKQPYIMHTLPWHDEAIKQAYDQRASDFYRGRWLQENERKNAEWWAVYHAHMASEKWAKTRRKILARAKGICEGCGERPPAHVHHLTYERLGNEMLFDLVAVCVPCHEIIHGRPIGDNEEIHHDARYY